MDSKNNPLSKLHPDEPFFIIRARDKFGPAAIQAYGTISNRKPQCHAALKQFLDWQKANPDKVRAPD